jgi:hypothetical protein
MLPTRDQIERAAYDRWLRRDRAHGCDRDDWVAAENELTFALNYRVLVEYQLDGPDPTILGDRPARRCRFCERTPRHTEFSAVRPVMQGFNKLALFSAEICDECQADCRDPLERECHELWETLKSTAGGPQNARRQLNSIGVFKSLIASALLIMPESELAYFADALEWVNNPDHEYDGSLFAGTLCRLYHAPFLPDRSWTGLARRVDHEAAFPYMLYFLALRGVVLQVPVPLASPDQDLDGKAVRFPEQSFAAGHGPHFREARSMELWLASR